jgi:tRNA G18 (ribose-2'-O)-methylase SpoU
VRVAEVADLDDPRLADFAALNDPSARRDLERAGDYFVAEGLLVLDQLLASRFPIRTVLAARDALDRVRVLVGERDLEVLVADASHLEAITGFAFHRGVLASAARLPLRPVRDVVADARTIMVVEGLNDHENLGALFRNAAALGCDAVLLDPTTADPLYRRSVRVSLGHVLRVPWTRAAALPGGLDELGALGFTTVALTPSAQDSIDSLRATLALEVGDHETSPPPVALVLGAEGSGLTAATVAAADHRARIPMRAGVDSLNVATR